MKVYTLILFLLCGLNYIQSQNIEESPVVINEIGVMAFDNSKYLELIVNGNHDDPMATVDLEGWIIDNNTEANANDSLFLIIGDCLNNLLPGTIVLFYNNTSLHPQIDAANDGLPNAQGIYQIPFNSPCLSQCIKNNDYGCDAETIAVWNSVLPMVSTSGVIQLRSPDQSLRQAVRWGNTPFVLEENIRTTNLPKQEVISSISLETRCEAFEYLYEIEIFEGTPGQANSLTNASFINTLLTTTPPPSNLEISCDAVPASSNSNGMVIVTINGGTGPYIISLSGPWSGQMSVPTQGAYEFLGLPQGMYTVSVTEVSNIKCPKYCSVFVRQTMDPVILCEGECLTIGVETEDCFFWEPEFELEDSNESITNVCPTESDVYTLTIIDDDGNINGIYDYEIVLNQMKVEIEPNPAYLCENSSITIEVIQNYLLYNWSTGDTTQSIVASETGLYFVTVTNEAGCTATDSTFVFAESDPESIKSYLLQDGYVDLDYSIVIGGPTLQGNSDDENNQGINSLTDLIEDFAQTYVEIDGISIDLKQKLTAGMLDLKEEGCNPFAYILNNSSICDGHLDEALDFMNVHLPSLGIVIFIWEDGNGAGRLFAKIYGNCFEAMDVKLIPGSENFATLDCGLGFEGFLDLILDVDSALKNQGGFTNLYDRIDIIRGIYYGTDWSVDYSVEQSQLRNNMFNNFCRDFTPPVDPRPIIGEELYNKLFQCAEVHDGIKSVDFGHLIIGLDARAASLSALDFLFVGGNGPEIVTWLGDLGAGAGTIARRRINRPNYRSIYIFRGASSYGASTNLEGDIAAFVMGWDESPPLWSLHPNYQSDDDLESILYDYLYDIDSVWINRAATFLEILGGEIVGDTLVNPNELIDDLAEKMAEFGEQYLISRLTNNGVIDVDKMAEASSHLDGSAHEVAQILVETLTKEIANPDNKIKATGQGPPPTPQGDPYTKYVLMNTAEDFFQWIKDQIND